MAYNYDELYRSSPNALGEPTDVFVQWFEACNRKNMDVLDLGCGQGRDAIFIAQLDHKVVGVDLSPHGIADLEKIAKDENLKIKGVVCDLTQFETDQQFDVILIDRTLHMLDEPDRLRVLKGIVGNVRSRGYVLVADEKSNIPAFIDIFKADTRDWESEKADRGYLFMHQKR